MNVSRSIAAAVTAVGLTLATPLYAAVAVVTTSADSSTGSLRQAILDANSGVCTSPCRIAFGPLFATPQTINITSAALPAITAPNVTIDGFAGPDSISGNADDTGTANTAAFGSADNSTHNVTLHGPSNTAYDGLTVNATGFKLKGLVIQNNVRGLVLASTGSQISGCFIGTNTAGTSSFSNGKGIAITGTGSNTIGGTSPADRNVISGNITVGLEIVSASAGNSLRGNYIGTNAGGTAAIANGIGIDVNTTGSANVIGDVSLGNLISGNTTYGLYIRSGSSNTVQRNRIGTNALGTVAVPNSDGIFIESSATTSNTIGGSSSGDGNIISGNSSAGVRIESSSSNTIWNNTIGLSNGGTSALSNALYGIRLALNAGANLLSTNKIAATATGIEISASNNTNIQASTIGYPFAPISGNGISISNSNDTTITGSTIRYSNSGIVVAGGLRNVFFDSLIFNNTALGIDLQGSAGTFIGATPNDAGDPDTNAGNNLQNFPVITSAYAQGTGSGAPVKILLDLDSSAVGTTNSVRVSLYRADTSATPQGETLLLTNCYAGRTFTNKLITDTSGSLSIGDKVIATVSSYTDTTCVIPNDGTSEFSSGAAVATVILQPGLVVNTADSGAGSLRQAITDANSGVCPSPCTITFNIPLTDANYISGVFYIKPITQLPDLMKSQSTLDGATQTSFTGDTNPAGPEIAINGSLAGAGVRGLGIGANITGQGSDITIKSVVVNAFQGAGIVVQGSLPLTNIALYKNYIGTDPTGNAGAPNSGDGIYVTSTVTNLAIGGVGLGNLISGNAVNGIQLVNSGLSGVSIIGNTIGSDVTGSFGTPNLGNGIFVSQVANGDTIIGQAGGGNLIAYNAGAGVSLVGTTSEVAIRYNTMFSNGGLAIDIGNDGVTANDLGDPDSGPNSNQNFPVLTNAVYNGTNTTITGTLNSVASSSFEIHFYENLAIDPTGYGEGKSYIGTTTVTTDAAGNGTFSVVLLGNYRSSKVTATATRVAAGVAETSEFSQELFNNPPTANNDTVSTNEDTLVNFDPRANDVDPEMGALTITGHTQPSPSQGSVACSTTTCDFTPAANYSGPASFSYTITDDAGATSSATVSITVNPVDDPPVANADTLTTNEDTANSVNVLTNDTDIDTLPASLQVTGSTSGTKGTVTCTTAGVCTYTPTANLNGTDSFTYTMTDGTTSVTGTVNVTIAALNDAPVAVTDTITVAEDGTGSVNVLSNDTDAELDALSVTGNTNGALGTATCSPSGNCTYTPNSNVSGTDSFTYTVTDGSLTSVGTVNVTITAVNDPPVATNDTLVTSEDTPGSVNVLTNDSDPEASTLTVSANSGASLGTVACSPSGNCTYTPNSNVSGTDSFTYTVTDGSLTSVGTVNVTITAVNDPPVAAPDTLVTSEDTAGSVNVLTNDSDPEGSTLTVLANSGASLGTVACAPGGLCTYTPNTNASGTDSFTYTVSDGTFTSVGTVSVTITAVNDGPVAVNDTLTTSEDTTGTVNVLTNDLDPEGSTLTVTGNSGAAMGSVSCSPSGLCSYVPNANANGTDTFTYTVSDGSLSSTGTVNVAITAVNDPPVASNDAYSTSENVTLNVGAPGVLGNDSDVDSGSLSTLTVTGPANGTLALNANGSFSYVPNTNFSGTDSFTYKVNDGASFSNIATVTITVVDVNNAPVANPDVLVVNEDVPGNVNVNANDSDPDGDTRTVTGNTNGTKGSVTCTSAGVCTYTPNLNANGADSFTYTLFDGALSSTGIVSVTINPVNDPPVAVSNLATTSANTPVTTNVTANDSDVDGDPLSVSSFTQGANGSVTCTPSGTSPGQCTYTPAANFTGSDSYSYTVSDGQGGFSTATVSVSISSTNGAPTARDDSAQTTQGTAVAIRVMSNDSDPDDDPITILSYTQPAHGTVSCVTGAANKSAQCTYTPAPTFLGTDGFNYVVRDPSGATDSAHVTVTVVSGCASFVTLTSPAASAVGVPTSGLLQWNAGGGERFLIYLGRSGSGCTTLVGESNTRSFNYSGLAPSADYEWRVEAVSTSCAVVSSTCGQFRTAAAPPLCPQTAPALTAPGNGTVVSSPVTFSWTAVESARSYSVFASVNGGATTFVGTTAGTSLTATLADGAISWFVTVEAENCPVLQSQSGNFTVCNRPIPVPSIVGQVSSDQTYTFSWTGDPGALYEVQEATNAAFTGARTDVVTGNSLEYRHSVTSATAFFYRVRQRSACAQAFGDYSPTLRVVIIPIAKKQTSPSTTAPAGSKQIIVQEVFVPGEPGTGLVTFAASVDKPWLTVQPASGVLPPDGVTLQVLANPADLPNGTFTGTVIVSLTTPGNARVQTLGTTVKNVPVTVSLVTPVTPGSNATPPPNALIIPSVGHLDGLNSHWQSDIRVTNTSAAAMAYDLTFKPAGGGEIKKTTINIDGGATTALDDIVRNWYGIGSLGDSANGTLEIREGGSGNSTPPTDGNSRVTVASSRTYSVSDSGTLGQYIPAVPFANFIGRAQDGAASRILTMQQIAQTSAYRTNVGVVEGSGSPASVMISVFNAAGLKLTEIPLNLGGGEQRQMNGILAQEGITDLRDGRIEVRVTGGEGRVTAYASVVDSVTNDPLLVSGVTVGESIASRYVLPGVADLNTGLASWRTDMRVFNSSSIPQPATLTFYPQNDAAAHDITVLLQPGEVRTLDNVLQSQFGLTNDSGTVHVTTSNNSALVVSGRTYNQTANGTFGQFVPAVTSADAVGAGERALQVQQVEDSSRYRTNLGIAEVSGRDAVVEITVTLPDSRISPKLEMTLPANSFRQLPILRELGLGNVYNVRIAVRVIEGQGKVAAYGSVIDMLTQDPTYVPAQ